MKNNKKLFVLFFSIILLLSINTVVAEDSNIEKNSQDEGIVSETKDTYTISYFDKKVGGNVLKNTKLAKNIPKSKLSKKIVTMSKKGSVILKFGDGKGPKILLCAGIHGNEVAANIATLKFLEKIKKKKIKGTLYVIPFIIPKDTEINSRSWYFAKKKIWVDPNEVSHISGTPGNKIVKFAKKNNIKFIIDIHTGGSLSNYKKGFVFANKNPVQKKETKWLTYIKKTINPMIQYNIPKKGYIRQYSAIKGINTITFEVERDKGSVSKWAKIQYNMLIKACRYFKIY